MLKLLSEKFISQLNLSHNLVSYLTRNSFPSQESLRSVDLSHNQIPVLTSDFTHKLRKVEHLNFSHNIIDEIRQGTLTFKNYLLIPSFD